MCVLSRVRSVVLLNGEGKRAQALLKLKGETILRPGTKIREETPIGPSVVTLPFGENGNGISEYGSCACGARILYYDDFGVKCESCRKLYGIWTKVRKKPVNPQNYTLNLDDTE